MYILGISAYFHDSAACLLYEGEILAAAQEERFTRIKNDASFPSNAVKFCVEYAGISLSQVRHVVFFEKPFLKFERLIETHISFAPLGLSSYLKSVPVWLKDKLFIKKNITNALQGIEQQWQPEKDTLLFSSHHASHAASAFYPSPFEKAVILTVDGVGEWTTTMVAIGSGNAIQPMNEIRFPHSLGLLYSAFTYYLGFKVNCDEYKVMGLAPYGKPVYSERILKELIDIKSDGSFRLNMKYFNYAKGLTMVSQAFCKLFRNPVRHHSDEIQQFHMDVASSIQQATEDVLLKLTRSLFDRYKLDNLCMAGGVALNCVANGKILRDSGFKNVWIQPAAGDAGCALGAALEVWHNHYKKDRAVGGATGDQMKGAFLGPAFTKENIKGLLNRKKCRFIDLSAGDCYKVAAKLISKGKVVGWFSGNMEFGPRALGARSILADPRSDTMQSVLNQKIKFRESFRPFAAIVLKEHASSYFANCPINPYMLFVSELRDSRRVSLSAAEKSVAGFDMLRISRSVIPAVTHVNGTTRVQTVDMEINPEMYKLLTEFYHLTDCPLLVNTSFNRRDEPIVNTPEEALNCFLQTEMDVLVMEGLLLLKTSIRKRKQG